MAHVPRGPHGSRPLRSLAGSAELNALRVRAVRQNKACRNRHRDAIARARRAISDRGIGPHQPDASPVYVGSRIVALSRKRRSSQQSRDKQQRFLRLPNVPAARQVSRTNVDHFVIERGCANIALKALPRPLGRLKHPRRPKTTDSWMMRFCLDKLNSA